MEFEDNMVVPEGGLNEKKEKPYKFYLLEELEEILLANS
jgi:hypothetical protein